PCGSTKGKTPTLRRASPSAPDRWRLPTWGSTPEHRQRTDQKSFRLDPAVWDIRALRICVARQSSFAVSRSLFHLQWCALSKYSGTERKVCSKYWESVHQR